MNKTPENTNVILAAVPKTEVFLNTNDEIVIKQGDEGPTNYVYFPVQYAEQIINAIKRAIEEFEEDQED